MKQLTESQKLAAAPGVNVWVGASAGTGKTHVLAARVLRMMLNGTAPENILCLTYTKAAAAEMAMRITGTLGQWVMEKDAVLARAIHAATGEKATEEMKTRARTLFAEVLDIPGGLRIDTIHAFCQSLLKRFPVEAALSPHFSVIEEHTAKTYLAEAINEVMTAAVEGRDARLAEAFARVAAEQGELGFHKLVGELMAKRRRFSRLLSAHGNESRLAAAVYEVLGVAGSDTRESLIAQSGRTAAFDKARLKRLAEALLQGSEAEKKRGEVVSSYLLNPRDRALFEPYALCFLTQEGAPRSTVANQKTIEADPALADIIAAEQEHLAALSEKIKLLQVAERTKALIVLGAAILKALDRKKRLYGVLDYEDLILKTEELLKKPGIEAWIRYKLDGQIDHILVDEGQDTNRVQWQLVEKLSEEFFAGESARGELTRTVFAVGDVKQSIFSFQGAEPWEFGEARERIRRCAVAAGLAFEERKLHHSFRSTEAVLGVVDATFTLAKLKEGVADAGAEIRHEAKRIGHAGLVELWPLEQAEKETEAAGWRLPLTQKFENTAEARLARRIAKKIHDMVAQREPLPARGRALRYGDILVLVRKRGDFIGHLIRECKRLRVPVAGADRMKLSEQLVVEDLLAAARFALLPEDDYTLACLLKGPLIGIDEDALFSLCHDRGRASLWRRLSTAAKTNKKLAEARDFLSALLNEADFATPFRFFANILEGRGGRRKLARRLGAEIGDPVDEFLNLCLSYEQEQTPSLQGFLSWFAAAETEIKRDMERGADEVRIMTIHGAKGLEAPVVFLPDTCHRVRADPGPVLELPHQGMGDPLLVWTGAKDFAVGPCAAARDAALAREREESNRLLYVALTRAEDRLYIAGFETRQATPDDAWYPLLKSAIEALEGIERLKGDGGRKILRYQHPQRCAAEADGKWPKGAKAGIPLPSWITEKPLTEPPLYRPIQPSRALQRAEARGAAGRAAQRALQTGTVLHKLLEFLPVLPAAKREAAALRYLSLPAFRIGKEEQKRIWRRVENILSHPQFGALFGKGSRAEVALSGRLGAHFVSGQVDRLLVREREVLIVDYKSDRAAPATAARIPPAYLAQLAAYAGLVKGVYPGREVRAALLWVEEAKLMEIPDEMLNKALP